MEIIVPRDDATPSPPQEVRYRAYLPWDNSVVWEGPDHHDVAQMAQAYSALYSALVVVEDVEHGPVGSYSPSIIIDREES